LFAVILVEFVASEKSFTRNEKEASRTQQDALLLHPPPVLK
jgi:hypothetical protein